MGGKRKAARKAEARAAADACLVDLVEEAHAAVTLALESVALEGPSDHAAADGLGAHHAATTRARRNGTHDRAIDPVLVDRYRGLLVRSGVVGDSVHHLPSRLRERVDLALRDLIVGVARDHAATTDRVDALVEELLTMVGERIALRVATWQGPAAGPEVPAGAKDGSRRVSG